MTDVASTRTRNELDPARLGRNYVKLFWASTISNLGDGIGIIAYPWLASAVTRNPLLISVVVVVQRLPWLLFSLPAGVITDRHDRKRLMVTSNTIRAIVTIGIALVVMSRQGGLPSPDVVSDAATVITTDTALYLMILVATLLLGIAEVLYDNSAQTFLPSIVHADNLEKANGRLWSGELVANTFAGPPLAALLIAVSFALPFYADAVTFAASALLIAFIHPAARNRSTAVASAGTAGAPASTSWRNELAEGFRWLWAHDLLRSLAITLGALNLIGALAAATFVLFGQEVLDTSPTEFAMLGTGGAVGGIVGGWTASGCGEAHRRRTVVDADVGRRWPVLAADRADELVAVGVAADGCIHVRRHALERDHGELPPVGDPRPSPRPGEQRLPVLRMGHDADRRGAGWLDRGDRGPVRVA